MTSSLEHLESLGWMLPDESGIGVRYLDPIDEGGISFPSAAYEAHGNNNIDQGFYLRHRADSAIRILARLGITSLWEIGAGNGNMAVPMMESGLEVVAVEPLESGAESTARHGVTSICATLEALRLPDASLPAVGMFDVLEHIQDPPQLVREVHRVLQPRGVFVVTVPALSWLWSDLDEALGHFRRYSKRTLVREIMPLGFQPVVAEYIYASLVPAAAVLRALPYKMGRRKSGSQVLAMVQQELRVPTVLDRGARALLRAETRLSRVVSLPSGLSVIAAFKKTT